MSAEEAEDEYINAVKEYVIPFPLPKGNPAIKYLLIGKNAEIDHLNLLREGGKICASIILLGCVLSPPPFS